MDDHPLKHLLYFVRMEGMERAFAVTIPIPQELDTAEAASLVEHTNVLRHALNNKFGSMPDLQGRPWDILDRMVIDGETNHLLFGAARPHRLTHAAGVDGPPHERLAHRSLR